jgi:hypothetical protein
MDSKSSPGDSLPQRILRIELTNGEVLCSLSPGTSITYKGRLVNPPKPARMDKINRIHKIVLKNPVNLVNPVSQAKEL